MEGFNHFLASSTITSSSLCTCGAMMSIAANTIGHAVEKAKSHVAMNLPLVCAWVKMMMAETINEVVPDMINANSMWRYRYGIFVFIHDSIRRGAKQP
jgi:hypothetical protein